MRTSATRMAIAAALVVGIGVALFGLRPAPDGGPSSPTPPNTEIPAQAESSRAPDPPPPNAIPQPKPYPSKVRLLPLEEDWGQLHSPDLSGSDDLEILASLLAAARRSGLSNPSGENYEIVASLQGKNSQGIAVFPTQHPGLTTNGELMDRWGTPYHFHSLTASRMEIRSAGPDGRLWTGDDLLLEE